MSNDFDWTDRSVVVVPSQDAVAVYLNPENDVVIRRERRWNEDEDQFIVIDRKHAKIISDSIKRLLKESEEVA